MAIQISINLHGHPYTPATPRPWLNEAHRADLARQYGCDVAEIEFRLDAHDRMNARIAERREYDDPMGYEAGRERGLAAMRTSDGRF